jgi:hypothetical protein
MGKHGQLARIRDLMLSLLQVYLSLLQTAFVVNDTDYFFFLFFFISLLAYGMLELRRMCGE